ncbi:hypothetical protein COOONC_25972 [Cooperia oncophora]
MLSGSSKQARSRFVTDLTNSESTQINFRYELLVKQLIKHTPTEHADHEVLLRAQRHIHNLASTSIQMMRS